MTYLWAAAQIRWFSRDILVSSTAEMTFTPSALDSPCRRPPTRSPQQKMVQVHAILRVHPANEYSPNSKLLIRNSCIKSCSEAVQQDNFSIDQARECLLVGKDAGGEPACHGWPLLGALVLALQLRHNQQPVVCCQRNSYSMFQFLFVASLLLCSAYSLLQL